MLQVRLLLPTCSWNVLLQAQCSQDGMGPRSSEFSGALTQAAASLYGPALVRDRIGRCALTRQVFVLRLEAT